MPCNSDIPKSTVHLLVRCKRRPKSRETINYRVAGARRRIGTSPRVWPSPVGIVMIPGLTIGGGLPGGQRLIRFENVGMRYGSGDEVLHDLTFELDAGSFHFLTGASGAGKSSLLKLLYLYHRPSRGIITFDSKDVTTASRAELPKLRRQIGVVFQDFRLLNHLTAVENVMLPLQISGSRESGLREHAEELLAWVGLEQSVNAMPNTLSGGEQQRLAIARAVIAKPKLLLADEPTGNVDPEMSRRLLHLFVELNRIGTTTVVATHEAELVGMVPAPQIRLERGRMERIEPVFPATDSDAERE